MKRKRQFTPKPAGWGRSRWPLTWRAAALILSWGVTPRTLSKVEGFVNSVAFMLLAPNAMKLEELIINLEVAPAGKAIPAHRNFLLL